MPKSLTLPAFAKINWLLKILGRRPDGFHEIRTILQTVSLADQIRLEVEAGEGISIEVSGREVPANAENLVWQAAAHFLSQTGRSARIHLKLEKKIPVGAGLGGGSSDAAMVLAGLNSLLDRPFSRQKLLELAADLGSDVPFFLAGGTVLASSRGEQLELLGDVFPARLLLLHPEFPIAAASAYNLGEWSAFDSAEILTTEEVNNKIQRFRRRIDRCLPVPDLAENDFDGPLFGNYPEMSRVRALMSRVGCRQVLFCGSGSTLLGIPSPERFQEVREEVLALGEGSVFAVETLSRPGFRKRLGTVGLELANV